MVILTDTRACLKAIEQGGFASIDIVAFVKRFREDPGKVGDYLQCALHKFCKQSEDAGVEQNVVELSQLCFSKESVSGFTNMDRFLGSLLYISVYFFKREVYWMPLKLMQAVEFKKSEIEKAAMENISTRNFLQLLHVHFLMAAKDLTSKISTNEENLKILSSHKLAHASLKFLALIKTEQYELGRKMFRDFRAYFACINFFDVRKTGELYKNVEHTLSHLLPSYKKNDFMLYYVSKMDQIGRATDSAAMESHFRKHMRMVTTLMRDFATEKHWDVVFDYFFRTLGSKTNFHDVKDAIAGLLGYNSGKIYALHLATIFNHVHHLWMRLYSGKWATDVSENFLRFLYHDVLIPIRRNLGDASKFCRMSKYHLEMCFSDVPVMNFIGLLPLIRASLKATPAKRDAGNLMKLYWDCVATAKEGIAEMKNLCCIPRKKHSSKHLVIQYLNAVGCLSARSASNEVRTEMRACCEELLLELFNADFDLMIERKRIFNVFQRWHYENMELKDYEEALFASAVYIASCPEMEDDAVGLWVNTKINALYNGAEVLHITMKDVIDKEGERMRRINPKVGDCDTKKLMMAELAAYGAISSNRVGNPEAVKEAIKKLWSKLNGMRLESWERATSLNLVLAASTAFDDYSSLDDYRKESEDVLQEMLKSTSKDVRRPLYAGQLKLALLMCHLKSVQESEDKADMSVMVLEHLQREEEEKAKFGEVVDANVGCDVMPSSKNFSVAFEEGYIAALHDVLVLWQEAADAATAESLQPKEFDLWLQSAKQVSQTFSIIGDAYNSYVSWILFYRIAKICNNQESILLGLSNIIPECGDLEGTSLKTEGDAIALEFALVKNHSEALISYWLGSAAYYLKNRSGENCLKYLTRIRSSLPDLKSARKYLYFAKYWCLVSKFLCLFYEHAEQFHVSEIRSVIFKSFNYVRAFVRNNSTSPAVPGPGEHCELLQTMVDVHVWASRFSGTCYHATFTRFFLEDLYRIFQKLVFPTRTAEILARLIDVDVMCEKVDDASVKLDSLRIILDMHQSMGVEEEEETLAEERKKKKRKEKEDCLTVPRDEEGEADSPRALSPSRFADHFDSNREWDSSPLRFDLAKDNANRKHGAHSDKCTCYPCRSLVVQILKVKALSLEAQLMKMKGSDRKSYLLHQESYRRQKRVESRRAELSADLEGLLTLETSETVAGRHVDFHVEAVLLSSLACSTSYAAFLLSSGPREDLAPEVSKLLRKMDKALASLSYDEKLLQWIVLELKLMSLVLGTADAEEKKKKTEKGATTTTTTTLDTPTRSPSTLRTPYAGKLPERNALPVKARATTRDEDSPNEFAVKPKGRRVCFGDTENEEPAKASNAAAVPSSTKKTATKKATTTKKPQQTTNMRTRRRGFILDEVTDNL